MPSKTKTTPRTETQQATASEGATRDEVMFAPHGKRIRTPKKDEPEVEIDHELLDHPAKMNYILLLALLNKNKGHIEFRQEDIEINDEDYNVVFAKSLDGKRIVVSIVSVQSGILKTPHKEQQTWEPQSNQHKVLPFKSMPADEELQPKTAADMMTAATTGQSPQEKFLTENGPKMPFMVGDRPETAGAMPDLGAMTREGRISKVLAGEELAAAERVEAERQ